VGLSFRQARLIKSGERVRAAHLAALARAINDRLRSGVGDGPFRIRQWMMGLFRSIRNCDASGLICPAVGEFFENYEMLPPSAGNWPTAGPGLPEGANVDNPIAGYIFGNEGAGLASEAIRFSAMPFLPYGDTRLALWQLGKDQRGGYDPATGALASPSFDAARAYGTVRYSWRGPFGNAYGSWMPMPDVLPTACEDCNPDDSYPAPINYQIKFKGLTPGHPDRVYAGTCIPCYDGQYPDHVAGIGYAPWAYYVLLNNGTLDVLPTNDYMEGPYTGAPQLKKTPGAHMARVFSRFGGDFRGARQNEYAAAGTRPHGWCRKAFDTQRFLRSQYLLAPAKGTQVGNNVDVVYPEWKLPAAAPKGTLMAHTGGGTAHTITSGFVGAAACAWGAKLLATVTVEVLVNGEVAGTLTVAGNPSGTEADILALATPAAAGTSVQFRLGGMATFAAGGSLTAELAELLDYKPWLHDLMVVERIASAVI
jgi:hypothetical protein